MDFIFLDQLNEEFIPPPGLLALSFARTVGPVLRQDC